MVSAPAAWDSSMVLGRGWLLICGIAAALLILGMDLRQTADARVLSCLLFLFPMRGNDLAVRDASHLSPREGIKGDSPLAPATRSCLLATAACEPLRGHPRGGLVLAVGLMRPDSALTVETRRSFVRERSSRCCSSPLESQTLLNRTTCLSAQLINEA